MSVERQVHTPIEQMLDICKQACKLAKPVIDDVVNNKHVVNFETKYKLTQKDLSRILYWNLPNVLRFELEYINFDPKRLLKALTGKYATAKVRDWVVQYVMPQDERPTFEARAIARSVRSADYSEMEKREVRVLFLEERTCEILGESQIEAYVASPTRLEAIQMFICPNKMTPCGLSSSSSYAAVDEVIWRVMPADRLDILCYTKDTFPASVREVCLSNLNNGHSGKSIRCKALLAEEIITHIKADIDKYYTVLLYEDTYLVCSK